ncbi:hypothetical protein CWI42_021770 [Ordospora colligata]|uniref:Rho-GAP domain-containing protein n=1 Tax=Ordospora colligata OC4 TaxID=1354746 RepID=A0A0B2ULX9_9MICR|nr:uncharacterized protein M896_021780 [Ordospora colligata OC4]KHN70338.1 hypothetical protein M896_021780 [Ordospora colligata OC4]TBU16882.1 hypothetical protein CWI41_021790 [Ordospora colligata]TBU16990.1 hypothetical protein CWI40_021790 [Ordospora colligata]TBU19431.1 hypothetical protein CWI42_021770 [Ordospora colligata]
MITSNGRDGSKMILYDSLHTTEAENLKEACMNVIEKKESESGMSLSCIFEQFRQICCCMDSFEMDMAVNESLLSLMQHLERNASGVEGLFINTRSSESMNSCVSLLEFNEKIDYEKIDVLDLAMAFRVYVEKNLKAIIPVKVRQSVIEAYKSNDEERKKVIISRIPFVLNDSHRIFLKSLKRVFQSMQDGVEDVQRKMDEVYEVFGPLVVRKSEDMFDTSTSVLKQILVDLMNANFDELPKSFFSAANGIQNGS